MAKRLWVLTTAFHLTAMSLIAAAYTHNPNWPLNIPIGLTVGSLLGLTSWPALDLAIRADRRSASRPPKE